ncbi:hypothetical protein V8B97DRAFT_269759 [Scleroderma yunnanense]
MRIRLPRRAFTRTRECIACLVFSRSRRLCGSHLSDNGCGCDDPQHQTECHDPLAALRKERGEKIFACHLSSCPRKFLTPKARRLHLIQAHSYPKEYFFAVTNKGVGGLLKRWGDGASMIRGKWKPRQDNGNTKVDQGNKEEEEEEEMEVDDDSDNSDEEEEAEESSDYEGEATPRVSQLHDFEAGSPATTPRMPTMQSPLQSSTQEPTAEVDKLAQSMTSLSLVPSTIRFGRGGKNGGFVHPELHNPQVARNFGQRGGRGRARIAPHAGARGGAPEGLAQWWRGRGRGVPRGYVRGGLRGGGS